MADVTYTHPHPVAISRELLDDRPPDISGLIADLLVYGQPRTNSSPFPVFVPFPRLQHITDRASAYRSRFSDALYAWRYGLPDADE